jgi:transposase
MEIEDTPIRLMQINQLRPLLYEFGIVLPQGRRPWY